MKTSDFFTASRIVLAPVFFVLYFIPVWFNSSGKIVTAVLIPLFICMEFTDFLDGYFARKNNEVSDFGKLFDPFADVLTNLTVLFCFTVDGFLFPLFFLIIIYREVSIMFLRMIARGNNITISAKMGGKAKTVLYIITGAASLFLKMCKVYELLPEDIYAVLFAVNTGIYVTAVMASVFSFFGYLYSYKKTAKKKA